MDEEKLVSLYKPKTMKVLIACEFSGIVREAFKARGHDAWSCDILDTEIPGNHIKDDVLKHLDEGWDLMIAHPPCTYLSSVQTHLCRKDSIRVEKRIESAMFFMKLYNSEIPKIAIENPTGVMTHIFRPADQVIHPFYFGDDKFKRTCLWLKNLPKLTHADQDDLFMNKTHKKPKPPKYSFIQKLTGKIKNVRDITVPFLDWKSRSRFSFFIANAMAEQWG